MPIAVDAMGGDHAPRREVEGAALAAEEFGISVLLVGDEELLRRELKRYSARHLPLEITHARQIITMEDDVARSIRQKTDSSVHVAIRLVREGKAQGIVSAGNTGAVMAIAKILLGTLPSVDRPALAAVFPPLGGTRTVLIDVGANVDCKPEQLRQFAIMGATYSRLLLSVSDPRVGLLSIGTEQSKGNELTREAYQLLQQLPLNFVGNVEGRDLYNGRADVIVCDGFIGNVALKISEGLAEAIQHLLQEVFETRFPPSKEGESLPREALEAFSRRVDYSETGGAPLLGVRGVCTICHGSSNANAIKNAIRRTAEFAAAGLNEKIEAELKKLEIRVIPRHRGRPAPCA
ncbi:MAG: phosphate acyltransferase PlsX [Acidobacteria bacterium]|nr:phosphate acyltransferase PlsX [Acidobacteriota bacterium]